MKELEKLAVLTALQKAVKSELDKVRATCEKELNAQFDAEGIDRKRLSIGGIEVGTLSLRFAKDEYIVTDEQAFYGYLTACGGTIERHRLKDVYAEEAYKRLGDEGKHMFETYYEVEPLFAKAFKRIKDDMVLDGVNEVIPGCKPSEKEPIGTLVRGCKPQDVLPQLKPAQAMKLLNGENNAN